MLTMSWFGYNPWVPDLWVLDLWVPELWVPELWVPELWVPVLWVLTHSKIYFHFIYRMNAQQMLTMLTMSWVS